MNETPLDHWRDLMVAALYDELDDDERRELEERIAEDETLRRDWQELREARAALEILGRDEGESSSALGVAANVADRHASKVIPIRRWLVTSGVGFAAAATIFLGLLLGGLRIDRTPAGLLVRFSGSSTGAGAEAVDGMAPGLSEGALPPRDQYVSRTEFAALAQTLLRETALRIDELERRQQSSQIELSQALYEALASRQQRQYTDLANQIQLAAIRAASGSRYGTAAPGLQPWQRSMEEKRNGTD